MCRSLHSSIVFGLVFLAATDVDATPLLKAPEIFAPGIVSGPAKEDSAVFTPDGTTVYFDRAQWPNAMILVSHRRKGTWSTPTIADFSGEWLDHDPAMAPDGSYLVYASSRPATAGGAAVCEGGNLWRVDRKGERWSAPTRLPDVINSSPKTYAPSIAANGSLYFQQPDPKTGEFHILHSGFRDGTYQPAEHVALGDHVHELDPAIAPDESFIVFDASDPAKPDHDRLFIAFREGDSWGAATDLGDAVNARNNPWGAHLAPDRQTVYFSSERTTPIVFPRSRAQAESDLARLQAWDNGNENIWSVSLAPLIAAHRGG
jgi:hypothetical protein